MSRKSRFSRKVWYMKRRNLHAISFCIRLCISALVAVLLLFCTGSLLTPVLNVEAEFRVRERIESVIKEEVQRALNASGVNLNTSNGDIALLPDSIGECITLRLRKPETVYIGVPLGSITGTGMLYGRGPELKSEIIACGKADTLCTIEETAPNGKNTAIHAILRITALISYHGLLVNDSTEVVCVIPVSFSEQTYWISSGT